MVQFNKLLGNRSVIKLLEFFSDNPTASLSQTDIIKKTKVGKLLNNFRGKGKINPDPIYKILCSLGQFLSNNPQINEIEINPLMVSTKNIMAVDGRIIKSNIGEIKN